MNSTMPSGLRIAAFGLAGLETLAFLAFMSVMLNDDSELGIGRSVARLITIPFLALVVPSLALACFNRGLWIALALAVLALPLAGYLWLSA